MPTLKKIGNLPLARSANVPGNHISHRVRQGNCIPAVLHGTHPGLCLVMFGSTADFEHYQRSDFGPFSMTGCLIFLAESFIQGVTHNVLFRGISNLFLSTLQKLLLEPIRYFPVYIYSHSQGSVPCCHNVCEGSFRNSDL